MSPASQHRKASRWAIIPLTAMFALSASVAVAVSLENSAGTCGRYRPHEVPLENVAHRALVHGSAMPNSLEAIDDSVEAGVPLEIDVRCSSDGEVFVIHDEEIVDSSGCLMPVKELTAREISASRLPDGSRIPRLGDAMRAIDENVPLLLDLKCDADDAVALSRSVAAEMEGYAGEWYVQSFSWEAIGWLAMNLPDVPRGILFHDGRSALDALATGLPVDFVGVPAEAADAREVELMHRCFGVDVLCWTAISRDDTRRLRYRGFDIVASEGVAALL